MELSPSKKLSFTYEVTWKKTDTKFEDRFDKYLDHNFFQHRVSTILNLKLVIIDIICWSCELPVYKFI